MAERVFVYGTLKQNHPNYDLMKHSAKGEYIGDTVIENATMHSLGPFPAVCLNDEEGYSVQGEVYDVENITPIDRLEGHPTFYQRHKVNTEYGDVWIYNMTPDKLLRVPIVESGVW